MRLIDPRTIDFVLDEVLDVGEVLRLPAFAAHDRDSVGQMLDAARILAVKELLPSYAHLDAHEPHMQNGRAVLPDEIAKALAAVRDAGIFAMASDPSHAGLGLPRLVANAAFLWLQAANISIANYAMLTMSAAELLIQHATPEQKCRYLAPMLEGRFMGTMALSEPHAGSSLGDISTTARRLADGRYALRGTKMWISGGEHDMSENIVHLMLARIEGAAKGAKGISLFIVPRRRLDETGRSVQWNNVTLAGLNHKMGQRGTINTILNVGETGDTIGEIIGAPGQGLACMFTMMNEARIGVSMGAVAHASAGFLHALAYARDRVQGRPPDSKHPADPQIPLIQHADVRRMLLQQKAAAEGGICFGLHLAKLADLKKSAVGTEARAEAALLLDFLTPVFKAWMSQECLAANDNAMQVLGGAGYTRDHPVEQYYRDNRLNPIHEGTNGIQALDLVARKLTMAGGRALAILVNDMRQDAERADRTSTGAHHIATFRKLVEEVSQLPNRLADIRAKAGIRIEQAQAADAMELVGATVFCWIWLRMAIAAARTIEVHGPNTAEFQQGKIETFRFVIEQVGPRGVAAAARMREGTPSAVTMRDEWFG